MKSPPESTAVPSGEPQEGDAAPAASESVPHHVVGIGASAGGLEALERLFAAMPPDTGMAFVVVQHLSPDFKSLMPELLERHTRMPVIAVQSDQTLRPDTVFVLTAGLTLTVQGTQLQVHPRREQIGQNLPINLLFESMARLGPKAVAVVLSGTGSDATIGAQCVHATGGLVLAQVPATARFDSMPRSAIESGCVDITADPADMPRAIAGWLLDPVQGRHFNAPGAPAQPEHSGTYGRILGLLHAAYDIDFDHYKPGTIIRRIERRLNGGPVAISPEAYAESLSKSRGELDQLFSDLLIGVTRFFRDEAAYETLRTRGIEPQIDTLGPKDELRIWTCGCSTGEEPYTIAMLALEAFEQRGRTARMRILATDLHGASLAVASQGVYTAESLAAVPVPWREKYFVQQPTGLYKVSDDLRRVVIFSAHNLLRDAAFTRIDIVTCRNVLIYFQPPAQMRALAAFHFALRPGGLLFLGESEGTGELHDAFEPIDRDARLYRKSPGIQLPAEMRASLTSLVPTRQVVTTLDNKSTHRLNELLLQRYLPTGLLVNQQNEVLHLFGDAGRYLQPAAGRFRGDLSSLLSGPLRSAVFMALRKAAQTHESVSFGDILDSTRERGEKLRVVVDPVADRSLPQAYYMVRFVSELVADAIGPAIEMQVPSSSHMALQVEELEGELHRVREALQHTVEELEAANEELQAGNEELMAANEELQSTNEELHAVNEELYSVNAEHELKIQELRATTADMNNLIRATELPILFLDTDVRLRMFTPAASELFPLRPGDIGRDLRDFMPRESDTRLVADISAALIEPQVIDRELSLADGRCLRRRLTPYRDTSNRASGLVLTYVDITPQIRLREQLAADAVQAQVTAIVESVPHLMWTATPSGEFDYINPQWAAYTGMPAPSHLGQRWLEQVHVDDHEPVLAAWRSAVDNASDLRIRLRLRRSDGQWRWFRAHALAQRNAAGRVLRWFGTATDVHDITLLQEALRERDGFIRVVADNVSGLVGYWDQDFRNRFANRHFVDWFGQTPEQVFGTAAAEVMGEAAWHNDRPYFDRALHGEPQRFEREFIGPDGRRRHALVDLAPHAVDGQVRGVFATTADVTALHEAMATLDSVFEASPSALLVVSATGLILRSNLAAEQLLGHRADQLDGMSVEELVPPPLRLRHQMLRSGFMGQARARPMGQAAAFPLLRGDGSMGEVDIQLSPIQYGGQSAVVVALRDMRATRLALSTMDVATQARSAFLANISHEIRTPLNAILGMAQLLELESPTAKQLDRLKRIEEASTHLLDIVNDILDLAKIEAGRVALNPVDFGVAAVVERSISLVSDRANIKHLEIRQNIAADVPAHLHGDARRIEQILVNYLANAVKFTPVGQVEVRVSLVDLSKAMVLLRFEVADSGIGIAPEQQSRLFMPFQQVDNGAGRRYGGSGLGLAISRHLARAMDGDCGVHSVPGSGSTFWFTARVGRAVEGAVHEVPALAKAQDLRALCKGRRILVVEDDAVNRIVVAELIRSLTGLQVDLAEEGASAIELVAAQHFDLVLMDMQMPGIDGLEATRRIRAMPGKAGLVILALTANVLPDDAALCLDAGMNGHLGKPLIAADLGRALAQWMPKAPARRLRKRPSPP